MKKLRVETHQINKNHDLFNICDELCFKSKNLYNAILYRLKQKYKNGEKISCAHSTMYKEYTNLDEKQELGSVISNLTIKQLSKDLKSFYQSYKDWKKNSDKYKGKPRMPGYKPSKDKGRTKAAWQANVRKDGSVSVPKTDYKIDFIQNNDKDIKEVRMIPKPHGHIDKLTHYNIEIVYEKEIPEVAEENKNIAGIDLGLDRLATVVANTGVKPIAINGKPVNNMNQYFNKKRAKFMSYVDGRGTSNRIQKLTKKRNNKIKTYFHKSSRIVADWCKEHDIDTVVIGKNKDWKNEINIGKTNNQNFVNIPFNMFVNQLEYKLEEYGIEVIKTEESYTSKASFLDNDSFNSEGFSGVRKHRGLYIASDGTKVNADVNAAYNMIRKEFDGLIDNNLDNYLLHPKIKEPA